MPSSKGKLPPQSRRRFLAVQGAALALPALGAVPLATAAEAARGSVVGPASERRILLSCKLTMIAKEDAGRSLSLVERLRMAAEAGFDGVDLDEAGSITPEQARQAVAESGVFVHNAINHDHWSVRLTSPNPDERAQARKNLAHCLRVSHAAGGSGALIVVGKGEDGTREEVEARCHAEMSQLIPLAAALGQSILIENVWNEMFYDHNGPPEQSAQRFVDFVDKFSSPWVGMYYDIGNHWKYGRPGDWIRAFGRRCVKLDVKGFSRRQDAFTDITAGDLPWDDVRAALQEIHFTGWATAEVEGGDVARLAQVRRQMATVFGLEA